MDHLTEVMRRYEAVLNDLTQQAQQLQQAQRGQRRQIERAINEQAENLVQQVKQSWPSRLSQNLVLTALYQQTNTISETIANTLRTIWQREVIREQNQDIAENELRAWNLEALARVCAETNPDLARLALGSWFIQFRFTTAKPYISHGDESNYLIDNPVTKDHVLGLPLIRPSSWKGNLRSVFRLTKEWKDDRPEVVRLFGNPKGADESFRAGRLEFYPTFFYRVGLEIINPHDRTRKVGKNPILFECVPAGAKGTFSLLYVPFDLIGKPENEVKTQAKEDLSRVAEAASAMILTYGFSAKRTSGYGTARDEIENGVVRTRARQQGWPLTRLSKITDEVQNVEF